jgi:catechol 2,3-dioxygenase-like lactoylglutathione lyase family enzyme
MNIAAHEHVSLVTSNLERSIAFYRDVLGLRQIQRPPFKSMGAWMGAGSVEIHLTVNHHGHLRPDSTIDTGDIHFALRVADFTAAMNHLNALGYGEDAKDGDPKKLVLRLNGPAPYLQAYLLDPDNHIIELNSATPKSG